MLGANAQLFKRLNDKKKKRPRDAHDGDPQPKRQRSEATPPPAAPLPPAPRDGRRADGLSHSQAAALVAALAGENLLILGSPGTGKSFIVQKCIHEIERGGRTVRVVAPTGKAAAVYGGGTTIHSFLKVTPESFGSRLLRPDELNALVATIRDKGDPTVDLDVLVIDEISMVSAEVLDNTSRVMTALRNQPRNVPFGGIQIILSGDFHQLPPVTKGRVPVKWAFEAEVWRAMLPLSPPAGGGNSPPATMKVFELGYNHRQRAGDPLLDYLASFREGKVSPALLQKFNREFCVASKAAVSTGGAAAARGTYDDPHLDELIRLGLFDGVGDGAGAGGPPAAPERSPQHPALHVAYLNATVNALNEQHLNALPGPTWEYTPRVDSNNPDIACMLHNKLLEELREGRKRTFVVKVGARVMHTRNNPVTQLFNGQLGEVVECTPDCVRVRFDVGDVVADVGYVSTPYRTRTRQPRGPATDKVAGTTDEIPLVLANAITIHKCQGVTTDKVTVDFTGYPNRLHGGAIVAISRATSAAGITLLRPLRPEQVYTDPSVINFYADVRALCEAIPTGEDEA